MDYTKIGCLIKKLRLEKGYTQKQLAEKMNLSDKTISKWERGAGLPDISVVSQLSDILGINPESVLAGDISQNNFASGNMKKTKFYVCPVCSNVTVCTGEASVVCCGRKLKELTPVKASEDEKLMVDITEDDWYISANHPMKKDDYISFVAFATSDKLQIIKQYPEWNLQCRIPKREHGNLIWYSTDGKLLFQYL